MARNRSSRTAHEYNAALARNRQRDRGSLWRMVALTILIVTIVGIAGWLGYRSLATTKKKSGVESAHASHSKSGQAEKLAATPIDAQRTATPIIATYKDVVLRLPVATDDLTEVALHQASYPYALDLSTPLAIVDTEKARKAHGTKRPAKQPHGQDAVLDGSILKLWRSGRRGQPDTALDVGAQPGDPLLSPVDGTVVLVKKYKLYKKWDDFEIHIQPTGHPELDVVMIHVTDPSVVAGDTVMSGVTKVGHLRKLSDKMDLQLATYTAKGDEGNHTHIQVNNAKDPLYVKKKHLKGAITVSTEPKQ